MLAIPDIVVSMSLRNLHYLQQNWNFENLKKLMISKIAAREDELHVTAIISGLDDTENLEIYKTNLSIRPWLHG